MKKISKYYFSLVSAFFISILPLYAQTPNYLNYNTEDGLPSSQFYQAYEDEKGYIWFTSDRGVVRYDGYDFKTYTTADGLSNLVNFEFYKENEKTYWVNGYDGSFSVWNGKQFIPFKFNDKLLEFSNGRNWFRITNISEDAIFFIEDNTFHKQQVFLKINRNTGKIDTINKNNPQIFGKSMSYRTKYRLKNTSLRIDYDTISVSKDKMDEEWVLTRNGAIKDSTVYFKGTPISSLIQTSKNGYWFTTLDRGIIYVPSIKIKSISLDKNNFKALKKLEAFDDFLLGQVSGKNTLLFYQNDSSYFFSNILDEKTIKDGLQIFYREIDKKPNFDYKKTIGYTELSNGDFLYTKRRSIVISRGRFKKVKFSFENTIIQAIEDKNAVLWLATSKGLYKIDTKNKPYTVTKEITNTSLDQSRISKIYIEDSIFWISTLTNGLFYKSDKTLKIENEDLRNKTIETLLKENDSTIWLGSNKGLIKLNYNSVDGYPKIKNSINYSKQEGLSGNQINQIVKWKNMLFIGTNNGINYFNPQDLSLVDIKPKMYIDQVSVNGKKVTLDAQEHDFNYDQNNIQVNFTGLSSYKPKSPELFYKYRLNNESWTYTNNRNVKYHLLKPGNYTFYVACQNSSGNWSEPDSLEFSITPHFTERIGFKVSIFIFLAFILFVVVRSKFKTSKMKLRNSILQKESELATLRNQMNPHFVYNSLNTLQDYILDGNVLEANKYVGDFAKLMRKSLVFSKLSQISLKEEVQFLEDYLYLEKQRFEEKFDFDIQIDSFLQNESVYITPLMAQPLVENAVKHAFKNLGENETGFISITYKKFNDACIKITVEDNGSGYKFPGISKSKKKHQSMGIQIIRQRIELLNQKLNTNQFSIVFLKKSKGTTVILKLPIFNK